jgi:hypothetical protein
MEISKNYSMPAIVAQTKDKTDKAGDLGIKDLYTQKLTADETKALRQAVVDNANAFTFKSVALQSTTFSTEDKFKQNYDEFQSFLKDIGYNGQSIADLSQEQAKKLVSDDGIFGITQTAKRISDFVINGANGDENLLRAGRQGALEGLKQAEEIWGSKLPDIAYKTMDKAVESIDLKMNELGFSILNQEA